MPITNPYEAYSDPTDPEVREKLRVRYGALEIEYDYGVAVSVPFGSVDGSANNNIELTFLDGALVDAKVKVPRAWQFLVDNTAEFQPAPQSDPEILPVPADRLRFLPRSVAPYTGPFYHIGQRFIIDRKEYLLCQGTPRLVALVGLSSGNRWTEGAVVRDSSSITQMELDRIAGGSQPELISG